MQQIFLQLVGNTVPVTTTQLCCCSMKAVTNNLLINEWLSPNKILLIQTGVEFVLLAIQSLQTSALA
jgi:hypothetical protein